MLHQCLGENCNLENYRFVGLTLLGIVAQPHRGLWQRTSEGIFRHQLTREFKLDGYPLTVSSLMLPKLYADWTVVNPRGSVKIYTKETIVAKRKTKLTWTRVVCWTSIRDHRVCSHLPEVPVFRFPYGDLVDFYMSKSIHHLQNGTTHKSRIVLWKSLRFRRCYIKDICFQQKSFSVPFKLYIYIFL